MKSIYLRTLFAVGLSLMSVLLSSDDGRTNSNGRNAPTKETAEKAVLDREFKIKYGQELTVMRTGLKVKFDSVLDDSRCPKDVTCVWAGNARILISVRQAKVKASKMELHTSTQLGQAGKYRRYVIKLVALDPYPKTSAKGQPSDYVATLLIIRE